MYIYRYIYIYALVKNSAYSAEKQKFVEERLMFLRPEHREMSRQLLNELEAWDQETCCFVDYT